MKCIKEKLIKIISEQRGIGFRGKIIRLLNFTTMASFMIFIYLYFAKIYAVNLSGYIIFFLSINILISSIQLMEEILIKHIGKTIKFIKGVVDTSKTKTVAEMILSQKNKEYNKANLIIGFWIFACYVLTYFFGINIKISYFSIPTILVVLLFLNSIIFKIRINKGFWGTNSYEAREAIHFILNAIAKNKDDFIDSDGKRIKLLDTTIQNEIKSALNLGEEGTLV